MVKFRWMPRLFDVWLLWGRDPSIAKPVAVQVVDQLLRARLLRLHADCPWQVLLVELSLPPAKRTSTRSKTTGWIRWREPLAVGELSGAFTVNDLGAVAEATRRAVKAFAAQLTPADVITAEQLIGHVAQALANIPSRPEDLAGFLAAVAREDEAAPLRRLAQDDAATKELARPAKTKMRELRGYAHFPGFPYAFQHELSAFADVLGGRLLGKRLRLPGYTHIYVHLAPTVGRAVESEPICLSWHRHAYAAFDLEAYRASDPYKKLEMLADATRLALSRLVDVDGLDAHAIEVSIADVLRLGPSHAFARVKPAVVDGKTER